MKIVLNTTFEGVTPEFLEAYLHNLKVTLFNGKFVVQSLREKKEHILIDEFDGITQTITHRIIGDDE